MPAILPLQTHRVNSLFLLDIPQGIADYRPNTENARRGRSGKYLKTCGCVSGLNSLMFSRPSPFRGKATAAGCPSLSNSLTIILSPPPSSISL